MAKMTKISQKKIGRAARMTRVEARSNVLSKGFTPEKFTGAATHREASADCIGWISSRYSALPTTSV